MPDSCAELAVYWKWDAGVRSETLGMAGSKAPRIDKLNHLLDRARMLVRELEAEIEKEAGAPTKPLDRAGVLWYTMLADTDAAQGL